MKGEAVINSLKWISYLTFWLALALGVYLRYAVAGFWLVGAYILLGSSVILTRACSSYYRLSSAIYGIAPTALLGILSLDWPPDDPLQQYTDAAFALSTAVYVIWTVIHRGMQPNQSVCVMRPGEIASVLTMMLAVVVMGGGNEVGKLSLVCYVGVMVLALRRRALLPIISLPVCLATAYLLARHSSIYYTALASWLVILLSDPIAARFFLKHSTLDSWQPVFEKPLIWLRVVSILTALLEVCQLALTAASLRHHKEWWVVVPLYSTCSVVFWLPLHLANLITQWKLSTRLRRCVEIQREDKSRSLPHIMASRGIRHFALITHPLMWLNLIYTCLHFMWSWTTKTVDTCGLLLACLPVQMMLICLLRELSLKLGGSCCGYALVTPSVIKRGDNEDNWVAMERSTTHATRTISLIQRFFMYHLIEDSGCEYLSDNLEELPLREKLLAFFNKKTTEGNWFDSYLLYYSGPVTETGDWVLKGGTVMTYSKLLTQWLDSSASLQSRLILVLDTSKSNYWVKHVRSTTVAFVGIQTLFVRREAEALCEFNIGDFTRDWVEYNSTIDSEIYSSTYRSPIVTTYGVSRYWTDFRFHEPTTEEMDSYWQQYFSLRVKPLLVVLNASSSDRLCSLCKGISRCFAISKMIFCPPNKLDLGHGFKMVKFFKLPDGGSIL